MDIKQDIVVQRARELLNKIDLVDSSDEYKSVWTINWIYARPYSGPNFGKELENLRYALEMLDGDSSDK